MEFEQKIKRLAVILALSLIVIFAAKWMLSKALTNLGKAAAEKKQQAAASRPVPPSPVPADEASSPVSAEPASAEPEAQSAPASAVPETAVIR
jgi:flagellar basal body-associated protein FliL